MNCDPLVGKAGRKWKGTDMTEITTHFPYADRGKLKWEEVKEDE